MNHKPLKDTKILLCEDEPDLRDVLMTELRFSGADVAEAGSATQALEVWNQNPTQFDVVISDMNMPGGSGMLVYEHVAKTTTKSVRFYLMTGASPELPKAPHPLVKFDSISKPFDFEEFIQMLGIKQS